MRVDDSATEPEDRLILIEHTLDFARRRMDRRYDEESDRGDWLMSEIGESRTEVPFEGWENFHLPKGYRFVDDDDREEYLSWLQGPGNETRLRAWLQRETKESAGGDWE